MVPGVWYLVMGVLAHGARGMVSGDGCAGSWCQGCGVWLLVCWLMVLGVWCLVMSVLAHGARAMVSGDGCAGSWCQGCGIW